MLRRSSRRMRRYVIACCVRLQTRKTSGGALNAQRRRRSNAISDFARELLMVADNLERTIAAAAERPETVEDQALIEGVRATKRLLEQTLSHFGVRKIDALGKRFNPSLHEAVMEADDASQPPGTVVRVLEDGYTIQDRLLRPARVVVARRGLNATSASKPEPAEADSGSHSGEDPM